MVSVAEVTYSSGCKDTAVSTSSSIFSRFNRRLVKVPVGENPGENGHLRPGFCRCFCVPSGKNAKQKSRRFVRICDCWRRWWDSNPRARLRTKRFRVVLVTTTSIHLPIHFALRSGEQKLPEPLDSPIIITKFPLSVNWFSSASAGYIFKGCAASCKKAAASLRLHLTDAVISGNVSKLGKSLTI